MEDFINLEHPISGELHGEFTWCLHCEHAHLTALWIENDWYCPSDKCPGTAMDAHPWGKDNWPRSVHPEYPEIPNEAAYYPLY